MEKDLPIGIVDSGVGGISVLRGALAAFPHERFYYFGDNAHAPYGVRPPGEIRGFLFAMYERLRARGIKALIIACNTAMSVAGDELIAKADIPVVGIAPDLSPLPGRTIVFATPATLRQPRFLRQYEPRKDEVLPVPCPGLVEFVEREELSGPGLEAYFADLLAPQADREFDHVLLGCTHYVFVEETVRRLFPGTPVTSGIESVLGQMKEKLLAQDLLRTSGEQVVELATSGDPAVFLPLMEKLLYC